MTARKDPYVCSKCGGDDVRASEARPSVDDRYAVGFCVRCAPFPKAQTDDLRRKRKPNPPRTVALIRRSLYDPSLLAEVDRLAAEKAIVERAFDRRNGKRIPTDGDVERGQAILARWEAEAEARRA